MKDQIEDEKEGYEDDLADWDQLEDPNRSFIKKLPIAELP